MVLKSDDQKHAKNGLVLMISIVVILTCLMTPVQSEEPQNTREFDFEEIVTNIQSTKDKLLRDPRGIGMTYTLSTFEDPTNNFGFKGDHTIKNVIKWPRLYIDATGINAEDATLFHRSSVYDFMEHTTIALNRPSERAVIYPARFMFSSGHSTYYKYLHYSEGYQFYRLGKRFTQADTIPECFSGGDYQVIGIEEVVGEKCIHIQRKGYDDIWLSFRHGFHVHKRVVSHGPDQPLKYETLVLDYKLIDEKNNVWVPMEIQRKEYFGIDYGASKHNQVKMGLAVNVLEISIGEIDDSVFALEIPEGFHVSDLIDEKYYYNDSLLNEVMESEAVRNPLWILSVLFLLGIIIALLVLSVLFYRNNRPRI